jgi:hypothetical protein
MSSITPRMEKILEIYKCALLTFIALVVFGIFLRIPVPFTMNNMVSGKVELLDMPVVRVQGGKINVDNTVQVEGTVQIEQ